MQVQTQGKTGGRHPHQTQTRGTMEDISCRSTTPMLASAGSLEAQGLALVHCHGLASFGERKCEDRHDHGPGRPPTWCGARKAG